MKQAGDEVPMPHEAMALEAGEAEAPTIAEATEGKAGAPRTSEAEAAETGVSRTTEAEVAEVSASRTTEAKVANVGASRTTEAEVAEASSGAAEPSAQDAETEAGQSLVRPPVQDLPPSQESAWEVEVQTISSYDTS